MTVKVKKKKKRETGTDVKTSNLKHESFHMHSSITITQTVHVCYVPLLFRGKDKGPSINITDLDTSGLGFSKPMLC